MQQTPLGTSHLILGDSLVRFFSKLEELVDHYADGIRRCHSSPAVLDAGVDEPRQDFGHNYSNSHKQGVQKLRPEEAQREAMLVCLFTTVWQKFHFAVLTVCIIPMSTRLQSSTNRRHNERVMSCVQHSA